jgi:hypothetical protein
VKIKSPSVVAASLLPSAEEAIFVQEDAFTATSLHRPSPVKEIDETEMLAWARSLKPVSPSI